MLKRMTDADQNQNYEGTFILRKADNIATLRVRHGAGPDGVWDSLESLNGEPKRVIRLQNRIVSIYPERELVTTRNADSKKALHAKLPENIDKLESFYDIQRLEDDRIASLPTLVVDLLPKDQYRYGYRYWIDKSTGMLLRCDLLSDDRSVVEQMMFTSLDYLNDPPQAVEMSQFKHYKQQVLDEVQIDVIDSTPQQWIINELPQGFMLTQSTMRQSAPSSDDHAEAKPDLLHMVYSDGLASVSVFIEANRGKGKHLQGEATMGAVNAYGKAVDDFFVTVVGEVPVSTVKAMALSASRVTSK